MQSNSRKVGEFRGNTVNDRYVTGDIACRFAVLRLLTVRSKKFSSDAWLLFDGEEPSRVHHLEES